MKLRFGWLVRWVRAWWDEWRLVKVPPPPGATQAPAVKGPTHYRALVAASPPSHARQAKGLSSLQRRALKRRARLHSQRTP